MRTSLTFISLLFSLQAFGQKANKDFLISFVDTSSGNERYGYKTPKGKTVIPAKYDMAFTDTMYQLAFVADSQGLFGINRQEMKVLEPFVFDNGPDYVQEGLFRYVENGKIGFANMDGKKVIPAMFDFASRFQDGLAAFNVGGHKQYYGEHYMWEGGRWGFINRKGETVIKPTFISAGDFDNGLAVVVTQDGKNVQINKKGETVKVLPNRKSIPHQNSTRW